MIQSESGPRSHFSLFFPQGFDRKERNKQNAEVKDLTEKDDDELVDIETFEEGAEKICPQTQHDR